MRRSYPILAFSMLSFSRASRVAAAAVGCVALALLAVPVRREIAVGPLTRVAPPGDTPLHPHPFVQLAGPPESRRSVWVSAFLDVGPALVRSCQIERSRLEPGERCLVRSGAHTRSFLISSPKPWDAAALEWHELPTAGSRERRYVQLAVVGAASGAVAPGADAAGPVASRPEAGEPTRATLDAEARSPWALRLLALAVVLAALPRLARAARPVAARRWGALALAPLLLLHLALLVDRNWIDIDEAAIVLPARDAFVSGRFVISEFTYPPLLAYVHMAGSAAYGLQRAQSGRLAFHDPATNQLYWAGEPFDGQRFLSSAEYRRAFVEQSTRPVRNAYAVLGMLCPLLAYAVARRLGGERAGFFAGLSLAVQPLLLTQATSMLPNVPAALLALLLVLGLLLPLAPPARTFGWSLVAGLAAFKLNPSTVVLGLAAAVADAPRGRRAGAAGLALLGVTTGLLLGHPSAPFEPHKFLHDVAKQAFHYGHLGHTYSEVDRVLPGLPYILYIWPSLWGNYLVLALGLIGALRLLAQRGTRRGAAVVVGLMAVNLLFLTAQFVQFGRNYLAFLALACVCCGVGADWLVAAIARGAKAPRRAWAAGVLLAAPILWLGSDLWRGRWLWSVRVTAREQAITWLNENAPLGARIGLREPPAAELQGVTPDPARFRVVRLGAGALDPERLEGLDYMLSEDGWPHPAAGAAVLRRFGPAGVSQLPERYLVYRLAPHVPYPSR